MQYNDRERLHKELDELIDVAEEKARRLTLTDVNGLHMSVRKGKKKGDPGGLIIKAENGFTLDSFAADKRDSLNHLYYERSGKLNMSVYMLIGFPAESLVDYEEWKAEQEAQAEAAAGTEVTTPSQEGANDA